MKNVKTYLKFEDVSNPSNKTKKFIVSNLMGEHLGWVQWKGYWRKYVYITNQADYDNNCLMEIVNFLNKLMDERRK